MKALAWDDTPEDYMVFLQNSLDRYKHIELTIEKKQADFLTAFGEGEGWDFVILDLTEESEVEGGEEKYVGLDLAAIVKRIKPEMLVIFVTNHIEKLYKEKISLPRPYLYRSKSSTPDILSVEIYQDLKDLGLSCNYKRVFLSYGHDRNAENATEHLKKRLESYGIETVSITSAKLTDILMIEIIDEMRECAAIISICTPDDPVTTLKNGESREFYQPRQNVIMETGIAIGMNGGIRKLIILQMDDHNSSDPSRTAKLPSNFGGVLSLRFKNKVHEVFDDLESRLAQLKVVL
jgi:predicted nucleotide-binding protein